MTLLQAHTKAVLYYLEERQGRILYNWIEITEIRRKTGCTKRQLEKIIDALKEAGEIVLGVFRGNVVVEMVNKNKKTPMECSPLASEEKGD